MSESGHASDRTNGCRYLPDVMDVRMMFRRCEEQFDSLPKLYSAEGGIHEVQEHT